MADQLEGAGKRDRTGLVKRDFLRMVMISFPFQLVAAWLFYETGQGQPDDGIGAISYSFLLETVLPLVWEMVVSFYCLAVLVGRAFKGVIWHLVAVVVVLNCWATLLFFEAFLM